MHLRTAITATGMAWEVLRCALLVWMLLFLTVASTPMDPQPAAVFQRRLLVLAIGAANLLPAALYALLLATRAPAGRRLLVNVLRLAKFVGLLGLTLTLFAAPNGAGLPAITLLLPPLTIRGAVALDLIIGLDLISLVVLLSFNNDSRAAVDPSVDAGGAPDRTDGASDADG